MIELIDVAGTRPWFSAAGELAPLGYLEREFLLAGKASPRGGGAPVPYRSRLLVRRPADPARFSGTVVTEWLNVSENCDVDVLWESAAFIRAGHVWVGVSAQHIGVDKLRSWCPERYGTLDVGPDDELSFDVFSQAGAAIRDGEVLDGLTAETVLAAGASQSSAVLAGYYDLADGIPFDGYACIVGPAPVRRGPEPVFHVLSETDVPHWWPGASDERPPDTDTFRRWEVAGTSHAGWRDNVKLVRLLKRDDGVTRELPATDRPPLSRVPLHYVVSAAIDHLARWARDGVPPPTAEPLLLDTDSVLVRSESGLAVGGIRLSQVEVPTAVNTGSNSGEGSAFLFGSHEPFSPERLAELYPSKAGYVMAVARADWRNVRRGYLHRDDFRRSVAEALQFT